MNGFKPMLAKAADPAKLRFPLIVQPKLDGIRASVVDGKLVSRNLKPIPNAEIQAALGRPELEGLDGELIVGDPCAPDAFRTTTSFVMAGNKTGEAWTFYAFDLWHLDLPYRLRAEVLAEYPPVARITRVANVTVSTADELERVEAELLARGLEGAILRDPEARYKFGRASTTGGELLKLKRFIDFEAEVIGVYEEQHNANEAKTNALGRTERSTAQAGKVGKGTLGGLVLRALNGPCEGVEFRCGTGFDAHDRADLWAQHHDAGSLIGFVAKIKSFPVGVKDKPRFPVWLGWRDARDMS